MFDVLSSVKDSFGIKSVEELYGMVAEKFNNHPLFELEYFEIAAIDDLKTVRKIERQIDTKKIDLIEVVPAKKTKNIIIESEAVTETGKSREAMIEPTTVEGVKHSTLIVHDLDWLVKQDPNKYVLQLIGAYEKKTINLFLKLFKNNDDQIIPFNTLNKGKKWHVLFYGLYENRDAAIAAIEKLPTEAKLVSPWPRTIGSIKNRLK